MWKVYLNALTWSLWCIVSLKIVVNCYQACTATVLIYIIHWSVIGCEVSKSLTYYSFLFAVRVWQRSHDSVHPTGVRLLRPGWGGCHCSLWSWQHWGKSGQVPHLCTLYAANALQRSWLAIFDCSLSGVSIVYAQILSSHSLFSWLSRLCEYWLFWCLLVAWFLYVCPGLPWLLPASGVYNLPRSRRDWLCQSHCLDPRKRESVFSFRVNCVSLDSHPLWATTPNPCIVGSTMVFA